MNLKKMFGIGLVGLSAAFAQDASTPPSTGPSMSEQEIQKQEEEAAAADKLTAPVAFVAPEIPKESRRSSFNNILHGKSYNRNGNMAAANNTDLLLAYPNLFAKRKFFYIEPTNRMGILSLGSFFTVYDISKATQDDSELGRLTLGYSTLGFGFYIRAGLGRVRVSDDSGVQSTTTGGDDWAFAIAKGFLGMNVALSADWLTKKNQVHRDPDNGAEVEERFDSLTVDLNLTNAPTAKNFTWTAGVKFINNHNEVLVDDDVDESKGPASFLDLAPYVRGGLSVLENENARILVGGTAIVSYRKYYDPRDEFSLASILQPSMLGEVFVGENKNFMFYGEVGYDWVVFQYHKNSDADSSKMEDRMDAVNASVGMRYQYKDFLAVELGLGESLFSGSGNFFNGSHTFVDFSAMLRF